MALCRNRRDRTVRDSRYHLTECLDADIARRKDPLDIRLLLLVRYDIALLVQSHLIAEESRIRHIACKDKDAERLSFLRHVVLNLARHLIAEVGVGNHRLSADALYHCIETNLDVRIVCKRVHCRLRCTEFIAAHKDRDRFAVA